MLMPGPGIVLAGNLAGSNLLHTASGATVLAGGDITPQLSRVDPAESPVGLGGGGNITSDELSQVDAIDANLAIPVYLQLGDGHFSAILDPDYHGQSLLALRNATRFPDTSVYS